jgi:HEAT repeat protein
MRLVLLLTGFLLPALLAPAAVAAGPRGDEQLLRAAGLPTDDAGLLDFFRRRARPGAGRERLTALVGDLGDTSAEKRDRAAAELIALGPVAVPLLRQAARDPDDAPRAARARQCLDLLTGEQGAALPAAAARLLAGRGPAGASEALLAYLPYADDETVLDEVRSALVTLATRDGPPDAALLRALDDPLALRRATAAEVLAADDGPQAAPRLRLLLADPRPAVRLRVALALARDAHDADAVTALIGLLGDAAPADARRAEDYLQALAGEQAPNVPLREDAASRRKCRDAWAAWWACIDPSGLLNDVRRRTLTDEARGRAVRLASRLGDPSFAVREKATAELRGMGDAVALLLRQYSGDPDPEVSARAARLVKDAHAAAAPLSPVVVRLLALRKPPGLAEALLAYLPMVEDDGLLTEVQDALAALAVRDGPADPALVRALDDAVPVRRGVSAAALWRARVADQRPAVRKLLQDRDPAVRLRVARAVADARGREAVPVLIDLLGELPAGPATEVDEYLRRVAGDGGPEVRPGPDEAARKRCRDGWAAWWRATGATVSLPAPEVRQGLLGYTLILFQGPVHVTEIGPDQKPRWDVGGITYSYDAQALPGNRVLIAEYGTGRVTERTTRGAVVWEHHVANPINCERLPNGHTVIGSRTGVVEVNRAGNEVLSLQRPQGDLMAARRARDGAVVWVTTAGECQWLNARGKVLRSFPVSQVSMGALELLPGGHVLVAQSNDFRVAEFDADGKVVWSAPVPSPASAVRLPNGHTLVVAQAGPAVLELDRTGRAVWEYRNGQQPWRARRR